MKRIFITTRNGLFDAFFFVSIGMYCAFRDIESRIRKPLLFFGLSMLAMGIEVFTLHSAGYIRENDMYLFLAPAAFFFFLCILKWDLPDHQAYKTFRLVSSLIFYSHLWVRWFVTKLLVLKDPSLTDSWLRFALTLAATIGISLLVIRLSSYKSFRWLKVFYT